MQNKFNGLLALFSLVWFGAMTLIAQDRRIEASFNCYSMVVGKKASVDGAVLFAHNEDDTNPQVVNWFKTPRQAHPAGAILHLPGGVTLPQMRETAGFLWLEMPGQDFSDSYLNEWGVAIGSDQCTSRLQKTDSVGGAIGYWLRRLMAERAKSARQAVQIGGALIEKFGYAASGRSYIIADPNEAWVLAAVQGKIWVAQRVPDDQVLVIPNYYTIDRIDLADTNNFRGNPQVIAFAQAHGWYDPERDGAFSFRRAYNHPKSAVHHSNVRRMWRGVNLLADTSYSIDAEFPFAFHPRRKLSVADLIAVLRDHYEGTPYDLSQNYQMGSPHLVGDVTICSPNTQYGFVAQLRAHLPPALGAVWWLAPYRPDVQVLIPWYLGITSIPAGYARTDYQTALDQHFQPPMDLYEPQPELAFWSFVAWADALDADFGAYFSALRPAILEFEQKLFQSQAEFEQNVLQWYQQDPAKACQALTQYTHALALQAWEMRKNK